MTVTVPIHDPAADRCVCRRCRSHDAGSWGPFTPREFSELFELVAPEPPAYKSSQAYRDALAALDDAAESFRDSNAEWGAAMVALRSLETSRDVPGQKLSEARELHDVAWLAREIDAEALKAARAAFDAVVRAARVAEGRAEAEALQAARDEARAARVATLGTKSESGRGRLRRRKRSGD